MQKLKLFVIPAREKIFGVKHQKKGETPTYHSIIRHSKIGDFRQRAFCLS